LLEQKIGDLKGPNDKDKFLNEILSALKKYLKMGKLWENAEKARIAEEEEMNKTMDSAKTATDVLHDILKTTLKTINPEVKEKDCESPPSIDTASTVK
jgi:hypothetical protein